MELDFGERVGGNINEEGANGDADCVVDVVEVLLVVLQGRSLFDCCIEDESPPTSTIAILSCECFPVIAGLSSTITLVEVNVTVDGGGGFAVAVTVSVCSCVRVSVLVA